MAAAHEKWKTAERLLKRFYRHPKTVIIYVSVHHGNTKKIADWFGIAKGHPDNAEIQGAIDFFDKISK